MDKKNQVKNIFLNKVAFPKPEKKTCKCGHKWLLKPGNIESDNMIIHHSRETLDSRNSILVCSFLTTDNCDCKLHFLGTEYKLLRINPIEGKIKNLTRPLHFISYDYLFEYHKMLMNGEISQNTFVNSKNETNVNLRGGKIHCAKKIL